MASIAEAISAHGPYPGNPVSITGTSTGAQDLGASTVRIIMKTTVKTHIRFGESAVGAATTNDYPLEADCDYVFDVHVGSRFFRAIRASSDGTLIWAVIA